jgi:class 3 adenylate cyclase
VLFCDLVGFTTFNETRDPEDVRDVLDEYFAAARRIAGEYGGTIEKFIGDAVMAVWGAPIAREDDAERAVRAGVEIVRAVVALADALSIPALRVRVGVLTGEAAVEVGRAEEGMVTGDAVNTAARIQSIADPGTVLVDDVTRLASERAIEFEDAARTRSREEARRFVCGVRCASAPSWVYFAWARLSRRSSDAAHNSRR